MGKEIQNIQQNKINKHTEITTKTTVSKQKSRPVETTPKEWIQSATFE